MLISLILGCCKRRGGCVTSIWQPGALSFSGGGVLVPGHPASRCRRLDRNQTLLSVDPVPLFLSTKRQRDFTSERFLAEQVGNHWFHRLEITGCAPLDSLPSHLKLLDRSWPRHPCLHSADVPAPGPTPNAQGCRAPGPPRFPRGAAGAPPANSGRREWLPGKSSILQCRAALRAQAQPPAWQSTGNNRGRLCSKESGCPKSRQCGSY